MTEIERLKEEILRDYSRLSENSSFSFACHPAVPCFNDCCGDVSIFLTPYDIVRLKGSLGMSSGQFLSQYTVRRFGGNTPYPVVLLRMNEDVAKSCPLVSRYGCQVYEDRPFSCRMYPLGLASPKEDSNVLEEEFYFLLQDESCRGFEQRKTWTVTAWLEDQGIGEYAEMGEYFKKLTLHEFFQKGGRLSPEKAEMFYLTCYDVDGFREFLSGSTFYDRFEVDSETRAAIEEDDVQLLKFGHDWLRFALFGERTLQIRGSVIGAGKPEIRGAGSGPL